MRKQDVDFRQPRLTDAMAVFDLIKRCPPLDQNSRYCNFLQCTHFAETSIAADHDGNLVGFVSGYLLPRQPNTLFIWQVAVDQHCRGLKLALTMLTELLSRERNEAIRFLETTIAPDNTASWALFRRLADTFRTELSSSVWLDSERHFMGKHDSEELVRIGPLQ